MNEPNQHTPLYFSEKFITALNNNTLLTGVCKKCGTRVIPPRGICLKCKSMDMEFQEVQTYEGHIVTYTTIHIAPPQFQNKTPYTTGIIELLTGERIMVTIKTPNPDRLYIGVKGKLHFDEEQTGLERLYFQPYLDNESPEA